MQQLYHFGLDEWFQEKTVSLKILFSFPATKLLLAEWSGASLYITQHLWNIFSKYLLIIKTQNHTFTVRRDSRTHTD